MDYITVLIVLQNRISCIPTDPDFVVQTIVFRGLPAFAALPTEHSLPLRSATAPARHSPAKLYDLK
jgi:hypothetical protein